MLIGIVVICFGVKYKNIPALVLAIVQLAGSLVYEFYFAHDLMCYKALYIDSLSLIMALIIGIIGTGICVYSIGYMHDFYFGIHRPDTEQPDRRPTFFALMFVFLSAMYGIIFFNNLIWLFTAWEVTTLCSFLLIGFTIWPSTSSASISLTSLSSEQLHLPLLSCRLLALAWLVSRRLHKCPSIHGCWELWLLLRLPRLCCIRQPWLKLAFLCSLNARQSMQFLLPLLFWSSLLAVSPSCCVRLWQFRNLTVSAFWPIRPLRTLA